VRVKLAYIGGGSMFVPSVVNGCAEVLRTSPLPFEIELALYDVAPEKAQIMRAYADVVRRSWGVSLSANIAATRAEALAGADVVISSVWLGAEHERLERLLAHLGFEMPLEGPQVAAWALACAPWSLGLAREMQAVCPDALFLTLMNPTDVIAGYVGEAASIRAAGLCVEADHLAGALAYYFGVPRESISLTVAGVNHDGWVLSLSVDGQDGYSLWRERWEEIERDPDFHPGTRGLRPIVELTGHIKSSAYHNWPYQLEQTAEVQVRWEAWRGKRELQRRALEEALATGQPIADPPGIHPERSRLMYPLTGVTIGRLLQSIATGWANRLFLQVPNRGAITNFPRESIVEVATLVQGRHLSPLPVGELPDWLGGYTKLQAVQRRLIMDYLRDGKLVSLKRAMAALPVFATIQQYNRFAETLHAEYSADMANAPLARCQPSSP